MYGRRGQVGRATSTCWSPILKKMVALASVGSAPRGRRERRSRSSGRSRGSGAASLRRSWRCRSSICLAGARPADRWPAAHRLVTAPGRCGSSGSSRPSRRPSCRRRTGLASPRPIPTCTSTPRPAPRPRTCSAARSTRPATSWPTGSPPTGAGRPWRDRRTCSRNPAAARSRAGPALPPHGPALRRPRPGVAVRRRRRGRGRDRAGRRAHVGHPARPRSRARRAGDARRLPVPGLRPLRGPGRRAAAPAPVPGLPGRPARPRAAAGRDAPRPKRHRGPRGGRASPRRARSATSGSSSGPSRAGAGRVACGAPAPTTSVRRSSRRSPTPSTAGRRRCRLAGPYGDQPTRRTTKWIRPPPA